MSGREGLDRISGSSFPRLIWQLDHCSAHLRAPFWMRVLARGRARPIQGAALTMTVPENRTCICHTQDHSGSLGQGAFLCRSLRSEVWVSHFSELLKELPTNQSFSCSLWLPRAALICQVLGISTRKPLQSHTMRKRVIILYVVRH